MQLKRVIGVLLVLPLLHLSVARAAIACERPDADAAIPAATVHNADTLHTAHDHHAMHAGQRSDRPTEGQQHPPGPHAPSAECCQAMSSCSFAFDGAVGETFAAVLTQCDTGRATALDILPSPVQGPEPPPPRE